MIIIYLVIFIGIGGARDTQNIGIIRDLLVAAGRLPEVMPLNGQFHFSWK
jgi:hypothetical protein